MIDDAPAPPDETEPSDHRLDAIVAGYIQVRDEGQPLDRQALLDRYPTLPLS